MAGVTSDAAVKFVRQACLGKISANIPPEKLRIEATANIAQGQFSGESRLYLNFQNKSPYGITELMIRISTGNGAKWNDYEVTNFMPIYTGPGIVTGLPPDPASYLQIKPFSTVYFSFPIREQIPNKSDKWSWGIVAAKGYLATAALADPMEAINSALGIDTAEKRAPAPAGSAGSLFRDAGFDVPGPKKGAPGSSGGAPAQTKPKSITPPVEDEDLIQEWLPKTGPKPTPPTVRR